jgi:hypothetical protein
MLGLKKNSEALKNLRLRAAGLVTPPLGRACPEQYMNKNESNKKLVFICFYFIFLLKKLVFLKSIYDFFL